MPVYLDTRGNSVLSVAICDRCRRKFAYVDLMPDPNFPGLRVCDQGCADQFDPYRLAARQTERINLRFARPDVSVAANDNYLVTGGAPLDGSSQFLISTEQNTQIPTLTENKDTIAPNPPDNTST